MTLESVRRELWDAGRPTKLAELGRSGARATLFDDRVEIGRTTIELVAGLQVDVTASIGGGYLTVIGPDASKTIKLRSADEADARAFAAAVRAAADRVDEVHAERSRRVQELEARLARLVGPLAEAERPVDEPGAAGGVAEGVVLPPGPRAPADQGGSEGSAGSGGSSGSGGSDDVGGSRRPGGAGGDGGSGAPGGPGGPAAAPIVPSSPMAARPGRARRRDGRSRRRRGGAATIGAGDGDRAAGGRDPDGGRRRRRGTEAGGTPRRGPQDGGGPHGPHRPRGPRRGGLGALRGLVRPRRQRGVPGRRALGGLGRPRAGVALLAVLAVAAGAGTLTWYFAAHGSSVPEIAGSSDPGSAGSAGSSGGGGPSKAATHPTAPGGRPGAGDGGSRVGTEARRGRAQRLQRLLRGRFKVVSSSWENDVLVARLRSGDVGAFFETVHASGLDPDQTVLEKYATVDGSGEVVAVYSMSRAQSEALNWKEADKIRWDDFLTYRRP